MATRKRLIAAVNGRAATTIAILGSMSLGAGLAIGLEHVDGPKYRRQLTVEH